MSEPFVFGSGMFQTQKSFCWNPDQETNPHLLIWGGSGAGKSRLLRKVIGYLRDQGKHVHVLDVHGDLGCGGENQMIFGGRHQYHGINPFEFELSENGGPNMQAHEIVAMFRKSYMSNMGPMQEMILRQLIMDTYRQRGIVDNDMSTWPQSYEGLPSLLDMKDLIEHIEDAIASGFGSFSKVIRRNGSALREWQNKLNRLITEIENLEQVSGASKEQKARDLIEKNTIEIEALQEDIRAKKDRLLCYFDEYLNHAFLDGSIPEYEKVVSDQDITDLDLSFYAKKNAQKVIESLSLYVTALVQHGVFCATPPPVKPGLNRYDLSRLPDEAKVFFIDILVAKVFRAVRMRGEYRELPDNRRIRGEKVDTFVVIDEAQSILPISKNEKESPRQILNRVVGEARKFGLGLIIVSQSPTVFPAPMFTNIATKAGLKTEANDVPAAIRFLGVKDKNLFTHAQQDGVVLVSNGSGNYDPVRAW